MESQSFDQSSILARMALRVPFRQPLRPPWRYSASCAQRKCLRTSASAVGSWCQASAIEYGKYSDLGSVKRGYFIGPDLKVEHSQSARILGHPSSFDAQSVALFNTKKGSRVMHKPDNPRYCSVNLRGAQPAFHRLGLHRSPLHRPPLHRPPLHQLGRSQRVSAA